MPDETRDAAARRVARETTKRCARAVGHAPEGRACPTCIEASLLAFGPPPGEPAALSADEIEKRLRQWHFRYDRTGNNAGNILVNADGWSALAAAIAVMVEATLPPAPSAPATSQESQAGSE